MWPGCRTESEMEFVRFKGGGVIRKNRSKYEDNRCINEIGLLECTSMQ